MFTLFPIKCSSIDILCRWALAAVFIFAGVPKLLAPYQFAAQVDAYGMLPDVLILPVAFCIPILEIVLAIGMILPLGKEGKGESIRKLSLLGSLFLLLVFIGILSYAVHLGLDIDCGCFGPEDPEKEAFSGIRTALYRDFIFLILAIIPLFLQRKKRAVISH